MRKSVPQYLTNVNAQKNGDFFWEEVFNFLSEFDYLSGKEEVLKKYKISDKEYWEYCDILPQFAVTTCENIAGYGDGSDFWESVQDGDQIANEELSDKIDQLDSTEKSDIHSVKEIFGDFVLKKLQSEKIEYKSKSLDVFLKKWFNYSGDVSGFFKSSKYQEYVRYYAVRYHG